MRFYIVSLPKLVTGGPEALHQLCQALIQLNIDASMYYINELYYEDINEYYIFNHDKDVQLLYTDEYPNVKYIMYNEIIDAPDSIFIIPEIFHCELIQKYYPRSKKYLWWLSYDHCKMSNINCSYINMHLFQSKYAHDKVINFIKTKNLFLSDYTKQVFVNNYISKCSYIKNNKIAINHQKDIYTETLCIKYKIPYVLLKNMSCKEIIDTLKECKIYIDNGYHPGKDRIPREAALMNCIIITNTKGSANNEVDIPIQEKVNIDNEKELVELIFDIFNNYDKYYIKQQNYRDNILNEKNIFYNEVINIIKETENIIKIEK